MACFAYALTVQRPFAVTLLAVMFFVTALAPLAFGGLLLLTSASGAPVSPWFIAAALGVALLYLACGVGLWTLAQYGRVITLTMTWLYVGGMALSLLSAPGWLTWTRMGVGIPGTPLIVGLTGLSLRGVGNLPVAAFILVTLHHPRVRAAFAARR
jgi:hypothetical protein